MSERPSHRARACVCVCVCVCVCGLGDSECEGILGVCMGGGASYFCVCVWGGGGGLGKYKCLCGVVIKCVLRGGITCKAVLNGKKSVPLHSFPIKARGHTMCWRWVVGGWRLAVGGGW